MEQTDFYKRGFEKLIIPLIIEQMLALSIGLFDTPDGVFLWRGFCFRCITRRQHQCVIDSDTVGTCDRRGRCVQPVSRQKMPEKAKLSAGQLMFIMLTSSGTVMILVLFLHRFYCVQFSDRLKQM